MASAPSIRPRSVYRKPVLTRLECVDEGLPRMVRGSDGAIRPLDLFRIVQSAFDEMGDPLDRELIECKIRIFEEISEGRLANAVRLAILAGRGPSGGTGA